MKKVCSIILALVICLFLCSCGKSKEVQNVETLIGNIGEVSIENAESIHIAEDAFNALSDKDKEKVENYSVLQEAQQALYEAELYDLANQMLIIRSHCDYAVDGTKVIWNNVGSDKFWTYYNAVGWFNMDMDKAGYDKFYGSDTTIPIRGAAEALCPSKVSRSGSISAKNMEETLDLCYEFNSHLSYIKLNMDYVEDAVRTFKNTYKDQHKDETDTLNEWCIELSMYADFALNPSGNLSSYTSKAREYSETMDRFIKIMDAYY